MSSKTDDIGVHVISVSNPLDLEGNSKTKEVDADDSCEKNKKCCGKIEYATQPWHIFIYSPDFYKANKHQLLNEVAAGLTVGLAQVSESVAFAFIAGVGPLLGLHAAWIIGLSLSIFGSRPGMILSLINI